MQYTSREVYEYVSQQTNDPIAQRKTCAVSGKEFPIYQSDLAFYEKLSPTFDWKKCSIPTPTLCPEERLRRRLLFRNEKKLYRRTCDASGKSIVSNYSPDKNYKVYGIDYRRSDNRDAKDYGVVRDGSSTFTDTFRSVYESAPHISLMVKMNENCDYVNGCGNSKNCYLVFDTDFCEDSMYSSILKHSKNVVDSMHIYYCDTAYNCINCTESFALFNCYECDQSKYLYSCALCSSCEFCINCNNLVGKKYCIDNMQYTKEEYEKHAWEILQQMPKNYLQRATYKVNDQWWYGNNLYGTNNCRFSYNIWFSENLAYCDMVTDCHNSYDISSFGGTTQRSLDSISIWLDCSNIYFSSVVTAWSSHVYYSQAIVASHHMFGCTFMKNASYCIFNKQYDKETREKEVAKIIAAMQVENTWWEFLPVSTSPFGYNETAAHEYMPLSREEALQRGYKRQDKTYDPALPAGADVVERKNYTEDQRDALKNQEDVLQKVFLCEESWRPFRIVKPELEFYRKHNLSLPSEHPDIRHAERVSRLPSKTLLLRESTKSWEKMLSVYPDSYAGQVYTEKEYQQEIFG